MVVVIGKLSHFGVYGKVFAGKAWMVSKLHLLSFCFDDTHAAVGPPVSSLLPHPRSILPGCYASSAARTAKAPAVCRSKVEHCLGLAWTLLSGLGGISLVCVPTLPHRRLKQCSVCFVAVRLDLVGVWGISQLTITIIKNFERCRRIKRSFSNKCNYKNMLEPCVLFNSCPRKEAFLRALLLSEWRRYPSASGVLSESRVALLCPGWQLILGLGFLWRTVIPPGLTQYFLPGSDFIAGRALAARPHRQLSLLDMSPCLHGPWCLFAHRGASVPW